MPVPAQSNQDRAILRDATVCTLQNQPPTGTAPSAVSFLGQIETVELNFKREFADVTGATDLGTSRRPLRWGQGSCKLTGFSASTGSLFAAMFAAGAHATLLFTEKATGDAYGVLVQLEDLSKAMGKTEANKDTLTLPTVGVPYYVTNAGTIAAMTLE